MSRRDTIIVAVLVNAALLMILFATAVRSGDSETKQTPQVQIAVNNREQPQTTSKEELLDQFLTSVPTLAETKDHETALIEEVPFVYTPPQPVEIVRQEEKVPAVKPLGDSFVTVTVKKGDFLEKIAKSNNTTVATLMKCNNLSSTQLKIGQVLKIPSSSSSESPIKAPSAPSEADYYIVKDGDSPWQIASKNHVKLDELLRLNGLDEQKARRLRPGDRLRIR